jgi:CIC family chloride channel protein
MKEPNEPAQLLMARLLRLLRWRVWIAEKLQPTEWQAMLLWAALAGFAGAISSLVFRGLAEDIHRILTGSDAGVVESFRLLPWWGRMAVPAVGGLMAGAVLLWGGRLTRTQSSTDYMEAIVIGTGHVPIRASLVKSTAALFSIGSGGSIGREGPMVQLSAMLASFIGRWRRFSPPQLRLLVACGAAAGIASAYFAPLAGSFFVAEIILGTIAMESLGPLVAASVTAALTVKFLSNAHQLYEVPRFVLSSPWEIPPFLLLGLLAGMGAPVFLQSLRLAEKAFLVPRLPLAVRLGLGGLVVGAVAVAVPEVCGNGYSVVLVILNGGYTWQVVALVFACKWVATAASFGSGAPGGVFTPSLFMGASAGLLFGTGIRALFPVGTVDPVAFALVGMGAFLAAATRAPVMAVILLFEMTLSYDIVLPLLLCSVIAYYTAKGIESRSLYSDFLRRKSADLPAAGGPAGRVGELMKPNPPCTTVDARFDEIAQLFLGVRVNHLYVTDAGGRFLGVIALHDIKPYLADAALAELVLARDIVLEDFPRVGPNQSLGDALAAFVGLTAERLPVVATDGRLLGSISKSDLLLAMVEQRMKPAA